MESVRSFSRCCRCSGYWGLGFLAHFLGTGTGGYGGIGRVCSLDSSSSAKRGLGVGRGTCVPALRPASTPKDEVSYSARRRDLRRCNVVVFLHRIYFTVTTPARGF